MMIMFFIMNTRLNRFDFLNGFWDRWSEYLISCFGNTNIIFNTDSAKIHPSIEFFVIDKIGKLLLLPPLLDQIGDKIQSRLYGDDKIFLQYSSQPEVGSPELF